MRKSNIQFLKWTTTAHRYTQHKGVAEYVVRAQEQERSRLGQELHDNVNQILTTAQLYLSVLRQDCTEFEGFIAKTMDILHSGIEELRMLSRNMVADGIKQQGLVRSIRQLVEQVKASGAFGVHFEHCEPACVERLDHCRKISLYRIVQEQLKNIIKYSKAEHIHISLHCGEDQVRLAISDDGVGFDLSRTTWGLGFSNIYERVGLYGGKVRVETAPGKGCSLIVNMPVTPVFNNL